MLVSDILKAKGSDVVSAASAISVADAAKLLAEKRIGSVLILDGKRIAGILSERDIVRTLAAEGPSCLDGPVQRIMTAKVITCRPDQTISEVMEMMTRHRFRHVPVVEDGAVAGMVSIGDVVKWRLEEAQEEVRQMAAYVSGT
ncbi:CBS domain-containing protein [Oceanibaculum pacificum]|uniref:Inosine-5-monophosphate dehydrogenase n=1 Tax=Oceanibaculum pacificum TaxID=580166 RepID=A0A154W2W6_9PROT|nr:CBS domain-containing protein [Oceanibaculum pacificum]KZD07962.1 inosine-5-monophosphate dehydrogenase [Oceanibaculum pacificum]